MRIGLFSDVHGDLEALQRCIQLTEECDQRIFLGDVAGGRHVQRCIELLQQHQVHCVAGNHDRYSFDTDYLPETSRQLLASWPLQHRHGNLLATHTLLEPRGAHNVYVYVLRESEARALFAQQSDQLIAIGHTHVSAIHELDADGRYSHHPSPTEWTLQPTHRCILNAPHASKGAVIYDTDSATVQFRA